MLRGLILSSFHHWYDVMALDVVLRLPLLHPRSESLAGHLPNFLFLAQRSNNYNLVGLVSNSIRSHKVPSSATNSY
jgi:hypothetical protein